MKTTRLPMSLVDVHRCGEDIHLRSFPNPQEPGIYGYDDGTKSHKGCPLSRVQQDPNGVGNPSRQRNSEDIIARSPSQVVEHLPVPNMSRKHWPPTLVGGPGALVLRLSSFLLILIIENWQ